MSESNNRPNRKRGGGQNRKSLEDHLRDGTYKASRHGPLNDGVFDYINKPAGKVRASAKSQGRFCRNESDYIALRNGCRFNEVLASHAIGFFRAVLCHSKGKWAGEPFELTAWQRDELIGPLFGWVRPDGTRRFRRTYIEIPKKNYKSTTASGIGLYMLVADEEPGAEVYSFAADKDQARIVHSEAINMVEASHQLDSVLKINRTTGTISYGSTKSFYRVVSGTPKGKHGFNIHCGVYDELHEWFGDELWNKLKYGYRARSQPLQFVITNAGNDMQGVCYRQREKAQAVLNGSIKDDGFFSLIMAVDRDKAEAEIEAVKGGATTLTVAASCNPALGDVITEDALLSDIRDAIHTPSELPNLLRLTYGIWDTVAEPWLLGPAWEKCGAKFAEEDLIGQPCYAGLDLSKTGDMTSLALVFPDADEEDLFRQLVYFWLPEETVEAQKHLIDYREWEQDGWLTIIPGPVIDYKVVREHIAEIADRFELRMMAYDQAFASEMTQWLEEERGVDRVKFLQTIMEFAGPTAEYERLVMAGRLLHNRNSVLTWQAGHCTVKVDFNKNKRPVKPKHGDIRAIDGMVAGIMALREAIADDGGGVYNEEGSELMVI